MASFCSLPTSWESSSSKRGSKKPQRRFLLNTRDEGKGAPQSGPLSFPHLQASFHIRASSRLQKPTPNMAALGLGHGTLSWGHR